MIFENAKGFRCLFVDVTKFSASNLYRKKINDKWRLLRTGNGFDLPSTIDMRFRTRKQVISFMKMFGFKKIAD